VLVDNNAAVSLGAAPAAGFRLVGWSGACSGSGTCRVTMSAAQSVTALFGPGSYRLTVAISGAGKVSGVGAVCLATCVRSLPAGEQRTLRATPAKGFRFAGWGGDCSGSAACRLPGNRPHHVAVRFVRA
jgi:hypothetical protein